MRNARGGWITACSTGLGHEPARLVLVLVLVLGLGLGLGLGRGWGWGGASAPGRRRAAC
ncbi:hypothetical protein [Burkholderia glumae]